jgi:ElaB/YqjD/DUF883 family membrane-anchored ribosome-binding protein
MAQSVLEQVSEKAAEAAQKASRAASAVADAVEDGLASARHTAKQGGYAAAEFLDDAKKRVKRNPIEIVVAAFAAGIAAGTLFRWMIKRRQC